MKHSKVLLLIGVFILFVSQALGCTTKTQYGDCVGLDSEPKSNLVYKASIRNLFIAGIFSGTLFVPAVVALEEYKCPVGNK